MLESGIILQTGTQQRRSHEFRLVRTTTDDTPYGGGINRDAQRNGIRFEGSEGWIWVKREDLAASDDDLLFTPLPKDAGRLEVGRDHMENFF